MERMESTASQSSAPAEALINWELAASAAARLAPPGPQLTAAEIGDAVSQLRELADASVPHVHQITGLEAARDLRDSSVLVVDRASWAKANTQSFAVMLKPAIEKMLESRRGTVSPGAATVSGASSGPSSTRATSCAGADAAPKRRGTANPRGRRARTSSRYDEEGNVCNGWKADTRRCALWRSAESTKYPTKVRRAPLHQLCEAVVR